MERTRAAKSVSELDVSVWWTMICVTRRYSGGQRGLEFGSGLPQAARLITGGLTGGGPPSTVATGTSVVTPPSMKLRVRLAICGPGTPGGALSVMRAWA